MRNFVWLCCLLLPLCSGFAKASDRQSKLIYCRDGILYSVPITSSGTLQPDKAPRKIGRLPTGTQLDSLSVSADGMLVAYSVRAGKDSHEYTLWLVADQPGAQARRLGTGKSPVFAPTGKQLAYTTANGDDGEVESVFILDIATSKKRMLRSHAYGSSWSANGSEIALIDDSKASNNRILMVVDAATGQHVRFKQEAVNAHSPLLSPDRRYLAYTPHMSRPKLAGIIADRKTGESIGLPKPGPFALSWSANSHNLLWSRYIIDPKNEGSYLWTEVWSTRLPGSHSCRIDAGSNAWFAPDGRHILYFRTKANEDARPLGLYVTDAQNYRRRVLEHCDEEFAVWKPVP